MDRLKMMWLSYLCVSQAACVLSNPQERARMWERANKRLDTYFAELEREPSVHDPVRLRSVRGRR